MSRAYDMTVEIRKFRKEAIPAIQQAAAGEWPFKDWLVNEEAGYMLASGESRLCGGEGEEEFADRLAVAIWKANGACCDVSVLATYLEELPYEEHFRDEDDYERLMSQAEKSASDSGEATNGQ